MQEQLRLLVELQHMDREVSKTKESQVELEEERELLLSELEDAKEVAAEIFSQVEDLENRRSDLREELAREKENVEKAELRLPAIKTQKEYVAVLKEIDTAKKLSKEIEESIELTEKELNALAADKEDKETGLLEIEERVSARRDEIDEKLAAMEKELSISKVERDEIFTQIPVQMRKRYELLFSRRAGVAVVAAVSGACLGCNMNLPPQLYNSLFTATEIKTCPHCNRLIYIEQNQ